MTKPFLKWVGSKRKLVPDLLPLLPSDIDELRHVEPFVGGGALFFYRNPDRALLADVNGDLIRTYKSVRDDVASVVGHLDLHAEYHRKDYFYETRDIFNTGSRAEWPDHVVAGAFIYLNKTCFNGLYRVSQAGNFNVPMGAYKNPLICDDRGLRVASAFLKAADIKHQPFEATLAECGLGDFVYLDPPYDPVTPTASFTSYAQGGFDRALQTRLYDAAVEARARGARIMLSNSDTPFIRELWSDFHMTTVQAARSINCDGGKRGKVSEVVATSYEPRAMAAKEAV